MKILISEKLSEHKYKTPEGYLICTDAILARTGKQIYTKDELFGDGDDTEVEVDRPFEQVMNEKTIASFENKPVTWDHPDEDVNVGNYKHYSIGYVRDVHQGKTSNGEDVILGNLIITDQDAINAIEEGSHTDLSCGYDCDIKDNGKGKYFQNNIRGNHVALCEQGRAGIARIVDSKMEDDETIDYKGIKIGVVHGSVGKLYEVRYNNNRADWPEYYKLENAKKYIDILLTKGEQVAKASWKTTEGEIYMKNQDFEQLDVDEKYLAREYDIKVSKSFGKVVITGDKKDVQRFYNDYRLRNYNVRNVDSKVKDEQFIIYEERFNKYYDGHGMYASYSNAKKYNSFNEAVKALMNYGFTKNTQAIIQSATSGKTYARTIKGQLQAYDSKVKDTNNLLETIDRLQEIANVTNYTIKEGKNKNNGHRIVQYIFDRNNLIVYDKDKDEIIALIENGKTKINKLHDSIKDETISKRNEIIEENNAEAKMANHSDTEEKARKLRLQMLNAGYSKEEIEKEVSKVYPLADSKVNDFNYSEKEIKEAAMKLLKQKPFLTYEEALQKVKENIKNGNYLLDNKIEDAEYTYKLTKKKNDYDEYVIQAYKNGKKNEDATYYTDNWDDAINTLKSIAKQEKLTFRQQGSVFIADNKAKAFNDSKETTTSDAIKMLNIVAAYKKVKDASTDKWVIKNTGLAYEVWNQGKLVKKFPAKKLAVEWIHSRFPNDEIVEDSINDGKIWNALTRKRK